MGRLRQCSESQVRAADGGRLGQAAGLDPRKAETQKKRDTCLLWEWGQG